MTALLTTRGEGDICTRYRPRRMSEIVGSKAAVKALSNALKMGANRPKAYLLFGDSGCGKTTAARIMAMGLNCEKGDTPEPCLECDSCKMALDGTALHITELNMADLNKKEDAEGILQEMGLKPWTGRSNCYIFDEAQMLTNASQNLLLKNLEEPPPNTYIFICTTSPKKIIRTLQSRCEKHHFKLPTPTDISSVLRKVFEQEDWEMEPEDKKRFFDVVKGLSYREVLKAIDQAMRGGVESLDFPDDKRPEFINMCRAVYSGNFAEVSTLWKEIKADQGKVDCEGLRMCLLGYFSAIVIKSGNSGKAGTAAAIMGCFMEPMFDHDSQPRMVYALYQACRVQRK